MNQYKVVPSDEGIVRNGILIGYGELHYRSDSAKVIQYKNVTNKFEHYSFDNDLNNITMFTGDGIYEDESTWSNMCRYIQIADWNNNLANFNKSIGVKLLGIWTYPLPLTTKQFTLILDKRDKFDRLI
jgi:hypothetical protein